MMNITFMQRTILRVAVLLSIAVGGPATLGQTGLALPQGSVGIGTYATMAQFKDLTVSAGDQVLLQRALADGLTDFGVSGG